MLIVMGHIHLNPSDLNEFMRDLQTFALGTRSRPGCLFYAAALEVASAGSLLIAERWRDQECLTAHVESDEAVASMKKWLGRFGSEILKYDASGERPLENN